MPIAPMQHGWAVNDNTWCFSPSVFIYLPVYSIYLCFYVLFARRKQTEEYTALIRKQDADGIMELLTDKAVERKVCVCVCV